MNQTSLKKIEVIFTALGGQFLISPKEMRDALSRVRCFIFDWDGVFHSGRKRIGISSTFAEPDSIGINLLRYGYWLINKELPYVAIITGENDETVIKFAEREHFTVVYQRIKDKRKALEHICHTGTLFPEQISCMFDDVNDLSMSQDCGLKIKVRRNASPLFMRYSLENSLCDYISGNTGKEYAVREVCELFLGLMGIYEQVVKSRVAFDNTYRSYWQARSEIKPKFFSSSDGEVYLKEESI